ncbi:hypothetical protein GCM10007863_35900 [Dyella mobilis]|nr:hypothetical protein GCM10007863_35900 [Dyella mobilis]
MGQIANRVCVHAEDIRRLEKWVEELAVNARVSVRLENHGTVEGIVAVTPNVQVFRDPQGQEGINGVVKLIDTRDPGQSALVWLSDIEAVSHLDSVRMGSSKA